MPWCVRNSFPIPVFEYTTPSLSAHSAEARAARPISHYLSDALTAPMRPWSHLPTVITNIGICIDICTGTGTGTASIANTATILPAFPADRRLPLHLKDSERYCPEVRCRWQRRTIYRDS